jgi:PII-like signaling protein
VTIHLDGAVLWHQRPAYAELVHRARHEGLAGASVFHGFTGFGADRRIHRERPAHLAAKGPCAVVLVDDEDRLRFFLLCGQEVLEKTGAVVVLDPVRIHQAEAPALP